MALKLAALLLCIKYVILEEAWQNNYDQSLTFQCGANQYLSGVKSQHSNKDEDRQWEYSCRALPLGVRFVGGCEWFEHTNQKDELLAFRCRGNSVITGVKSEHDNKSEDRVFGFCCSDLANRELGSCYFTTFLNKYDGFMNYYAPKNYAIVGFASEHSNRHEDRHWKAEICEIENKKFFKVPRV